MIRRWLPLMVALGVAVLLGGVVALRLLDRTPKVKVGSKAFTESVILGDILTGLVRDTGRRAVHRREMGGTQVLWQALLEGSVDVYPEYTGTIAEEILGGQPQRDEDSLRAALAERGVRMSRPLGFNNTYALGMSEKRAERLGVRRVSDLTRHPELRFGFSNEFLKRKDGWDGLRRHYGLPQRDVVGMEHELAYRSLDAGGIDVTELYSTDANIRFHGLRVLEDDRRYFPDYQAVLLYRADLETREPAVVASLLRLEGAIDVEAMTTMNAEVTLKREPESRVAAEFLGSRMGVKAEAHEEGLAARLWRRTVEHLELVGISLAMAVLAAVPLGVVAAKLPRLGQVILAVVGVIQTIPSLAVLVFMIPLLSTGTWPAVVALFLYSLLPIVRNTYAGLHDVPLSLRESALALGLPAWARLWRVELPMASRSILAGVKTAAVINVGTATIGALIGAGGYGQPILTGIRLNDTALILEGAIPAALLALLVQALFELAERTLVSPGLRLK
jgi:osmoprotectant transport system permease protein